MLPPAVLNHDAPMLLLTALGIVCCHEAVATASGLHKSYRIISGLVLCGLVLIYSNTLLKEDRERRLPVHERKPAKSLTSTLTAHAAFALATLYYSLWARIGLAVSMWLLVSHIAAAGLACLQTWRRQSDELAEKEKEGRKGSLDRETFESII